MTTTSTTVMTMLTSLRRAATRAILSRRRKTKISLVFVLAVTALLFLHRWAEPLEALEDEEVSTEELVPDVPEESDDDHDHDDDDNPERAVAEDMAERRSVMREACRRNGLDKRGKDRLHQLYPWEYFVSKKYKLVWCNVFKSGSSSWLYVFNQLAGVNVSSMSPGSKQLLKTPLVAMARDRYGRPTAAELAAAAADPEAQVFIVARHPFQRLVSGYRDKFEKAIPGSHHDKLGRKIVERYRQHRPREQARQKRFAPLMHNPYFRGRRDKISSRMALRQRQRFRNPSRYPTFPEFVRYLLDEVAEGNELDMHWTPAFSFCNPCQLNFTHVVRFETFNRDQEDILRRAGIINQVETRHVNRSPADVGPNSPSSADLTRSYLSQLDPDLLSGLCDLYRVDFQIFGYGESACGIESGSPSSDPPGHPVIA